MRRANGGVSHDLLLVLKGIADVAVLVTQGANLSVVLLILIGQVPVPLIVVTLPRNIVLEQDVTDASLGSARNGERGVVRVRVRVGITSIAEITRVVIIQQVVVIRIAVRLDRRSERGEICNDGTDTRLRRIRAVAVG